MTRGKMLLAAIGVALILALAWSWWVGEAPPPRHRWLPELQFGSEKLVALDIDAPEGQAIIRARLTADGWYDERRQQPLAVEPLAAFIVALARVEIISAETSLVRNYHQYNQLMPGAGAHSAWRVALRSRGGYDRTLYIGQTAHGTYGRDSADPLVFGLNAPLPLPSPTADAWLAEPQPAQP